MADIQKLLHDEQHHSDSEPGRVAVDPDVVKGPDQAPLVVNQGPILCVSSGAITRHSFIDH